MNDEQITQVLAEVGAAWLMDEDDEMCQANALRHLVDAAIASVRERHIRCPLTVEQIDGMLLDDAPNRREMHDLVRVVERAHGIVA